MAKGASRYWQLGRARSHARKGVYKPVWIRTVFCALKEREVSL